MAYTLREIARQAVSQLGLNTGYELGTQFAGQRYAQLCAMARFRHLRKYGQLYLPAPINAGLASLTFDSTVITLNTAALASCQSNKFLQWPDGFAGLFFRAQIGITWYRISQAGVALAANPWGLTAGTGYLILETPFAYDNSYLATQPSTVATNLGFYIVPRYQNLNPDARQLGMFMADYIFKPLRWLSEDQLNLIEPSRFLVSAYPQYVAELNSNFSIDGMPKQVEIYPYPTQSTTIHYTYWKNPEILNYQAYLPPTIDPDVIRTGAMADLASNRMGAAMRMGKLEEAAMWRNIANQERTMFDSKVGRAIRNDRGADDLKFILDRGHWRGPADFDPIKTAYDNFLARGW